MNTQSIQPQIGTGFFSHLKNTKEKVREILERYPETRDSDNKLVLKFWTIERKNSIPVERFTNVLSITRAARLLRASEPHLQGPSYKRRKEKEEPEVRQNISSISN